METRNAPFSEIPTLRSRRLVLRALERKDAAGLQSLVDDPAVYRWLPAFLFEKRLPDVRDVIDRLYTECLRESLILGVFEDGEFRGLAELYGHRAQIHKISVGYRLPRCFWGRGIASETLGAMLRYLFDETDTEIVTASTMIENRASANVLRKNGFQLVAHAVGEDWGYPEPTVTDKWIR